MFTQIQTELDLLIIEVEKQFGYVSALRADESNPNLYTEYGGRMIGLTDAMSEIKKTKKRIDEHITDILKNTIDGEYLNNISILEDENSVLQDKVELLEKKNKKYERLRNKAKNE